MKNQATNHFQLSIVHLADIGSNVCHLSQDIFQAKIDQTLEDCEGVVGIADDIVISRKTEEEHDRNLHRMIGRCRSTGLKLNPDKCFIKQKKIKFYGLICGPDGIQPDPDKVSVLK